VPANIYQDVILNGRVIARGKTHCATRYALLRPTLESVRRPFRLLDIGANLGYFSFRAAADFGATAIMIDECEELQDLCATSKPSSVVYLKRRCSVADLERLAALDHFDVVLALNVLHHFHNWRRAADIVLSLGDRVIIQTPGTDDIWADDFALAQGLIEYLSALSPRVLGEPSSHATPDGKRPMLLFDQTKSPQGEAESGIKLTTLVAFNCVYPDAIDFRKELRTCGLEQHTGCVFDGKDIHHRKVLAQLT